MKQSQEVPCHVFSDHELIASMASYPYVWARAKSGGVLDVLSEEETSYTNPFRFDRRSFRDCFPIAAQCLDSLRSLYVKYKCEIENEKVNKWRALQNENPEIAAKWSPNGYQSFIAADVFDEILFFFLTKGNVGTSRTLSVIACKGGEYNNINEIRASLLAKFLIDNAMTATCDDSGVLSPVFVNSKESIQ